jgi:hypothetical protein
MRPYIEPLAEALARPPEPHTLYRAEVKRYAAFDPFATEYGGEWYTTDPKLEVLAFKVHKWTECGATIGHWSGARRKWVDLRPGAKHWASRTIPEALEALIKRRDAQIYILKKQLHTAKLERTLAINACKGLEGMAGELLSATETSDAYPTPR